MRQVSFWLPSAALEISVLKAQVEAISGVVAAGSWVPVEGVSSLTRAEGATQTCSADVSPKRRRRRRRGRAARRSSDSPAVAAADDLCAPNLSVQAHPAAAGERASQVGGQPPATAAPAPASHGAVSQQAAGPPAAEVPAPSPPASPPLGLASLDEAAAADFLSGACMDIFVREFALPVRAVLGVPSLGLQDVVTAVGESWARTRLAIEASGTWAPSDDCSCSAAGDVEDAVWNFLNSVPTCESGRPCLRRTKVEDAYKAALGKLVAARVAARREGGAPPSAGLPVQS